MNFSRFMKNKLDKIDTIYATQRQWEVGRLMKKKREPEREREKRKAVFK